MKGVFLVVFFMSCSFATWSQTGTGKVHFIRSTGFYGSAVAFRVFIDDQLVCKLNNNRYSIHEIPVGQHKILVEFGDRKGNLKTEPLVLDIKEGETNYIEITLFSKFGKTLFFCNRVSIYYIIRALPKCKEDKSCL